MVDRRNFINIIPKRFRSSFHSFHTFRILYVISSKSNLIACYRQYSSAKRYTTASRRRWRKADGDKMQRNWAGNSLYRIVLLARVVLYRYGRLYSSVKSPNSLLRRCTTLYDSNYYLILNIKS